MKYLSCRVICNTMSKVTAGFTRACYDLVAIKAGANFEASPVNSRLQVQTNSQQIRENPFLSIKVSSFDSVDHLSKISYYICKHHLLSAPPPIPFPHPRPRPRFQSQDIKHHKS